LVVSVAYPPVGAEARATTDGAPVTATSPLVAGNFFLFNTTTIRVKFFSTTGYQSGRESHELIATYTQVQDTSPTYPPPAVTCGTPSWEFSGTQFHTSGNLTLTISTAGSTIWYKKNAGATTAYSTPIALASTSTGDKVEFWATKSGLNDSPHRTFNNIHETTYGGGSHNPPRGPIQ
jgi:hypothetical protein